MILSFNHYINEKYELDIRNNYQKFGVENYYKNVKHEYKNPHLSYIEESILKIINDYNIDFSKVLDLACGTGEITTILKEYNINNQNIIPKNLFLKKIVMELARQLNQCLR